MGVAVSAIMTAFTISLVVSLCAVFAFTDIKPIVMFNIAVLPTAFLESLRTIRGGRVLRNFLALDLLLATVPSRANHRRAS